MSNTPKPWLLPSGFEDILPARAERIESLRRQFLDLYRVWGYQLVIPPIMEHLETLLTGVGQELDLQTFKLTDQETGRMLGLRSDITPQVARIDAHRFHAALPNRLCYADAVLRAVPDHYGSTRAPLQVGAELFGVDNADADLEVITLMIKSLHLAGLNDFVLDIGHLGILRSLLDTLSGEGDWRDQIYAALQRKSPAALAAAVKRTDASDAALARIASLLRLEGDESVLAAARRVFSGTPEADVTAGLDRLQAVQRELSVRFPGLRIQFDLGEVRGYRYHTGLIFSVFTPGQGEAIAHGGRYNDIGRAFGRGRPATGFSIDLKEMIPPQQALRSERIWAPSGTRAALLEAIERLRAQGRVLVQSVTDETVDPLQEAKGLGCSSILQESGEGEWRVVELSA